jgi:hypothetical protein
MLSVKLYSSGFAIIINDRRQERDLIKPILQILEMFDINQILLLVFTTLV